MPVLDHDIVKKSIDRIEKPRGGTNFWDALRFVLDHVLGQTRAEHRRSAVIVMTDGVDNALPDVVGEGSTILLTTQYLEEADELADRIAVVDSGKVIAEGTSDELKDRLGGNRLEIALARDADLQRAAEIVRRHLAAEAVVDSAQRRVSGPARKGTSELPALVRDLDAAGVTIVEIELHRPSLDDVFLTLTGHQAEQEPEVPAKRAGRAR